MVRAVTGGIGLLHTGDDGSGDGRGTSYRRWREQRQDFITEMVGAVTEAALHTGDGGSADRRLHTRDAMPDAQ